MRFPELADKREALDVDAFAAALDLEETLDEKPEHVKRMIVDALRFSATHGLCGPTSRLDAADQSRRRKPAVSPEQQTSPRRLDK